MRGRTSKERRRFRLLNAASGLAFALLACGCSTSDSLLGSFSKPSAQSASTNTSGTPTSFTDRMNSLFLGSSTASASNDKPAAIEQLGAYDCPTLTVRQGASTLSVQGPGNDPSPTNLRYQGSIGQTARECALRGPNLAIKVGIQGRIILGPMGGPGLLEVPMRLALVQEGPEPKTIWTKLYKVPVTIPEGQTNVPFVQIEEDLVVPKPTAEQLEAFIVYVGFDSEGLKEKKPPAKSKQPVKRKGTS
ncbi:MAG TPA: hypothetical protein VHN11_05575 [Xanthobacteraceae bacterium]|jgi:hypothetical protein|nr:hypothetical protein [Xanthobacteraceae bacterium]